MPEIDSPLSSAASFERTSAVQRSVAFASTFISNFSVLDSVPHFAVTVIFTVVAFSACFIMSVPASENEALPVTS